MSAGLSARPGEPLAAEADQALATIGLPGIEHRSGNLTHRLAEKAEIIFCMTEEHGKQLRAMFPETASKVHCLQPLGDIQDPSGKGPAAFQELAALLQDVIGEQLNALSIEAA
jgi:protein-tyrosine-phosphatase